MSNVVAATKYWARATVQPDRAITALKAEPGKGLMIAPPLWQMALVAIGLRRTHGVSWLRDLLIGFLSVAVFFIMFLTFMR